MNINLDNKKLNLAEQFARFALYFKKQADTGAYKEQPMGVGQEDSKLTKYFETTKQRNDEHGTSY